MTEARFIIPFLETDRLMLRDYRPDDIEDFVAFQASPRARFMGGPMPREAALRSLALHLDHWAKRGFGFWAVEEKATGLFCGHVGLWYPDGWPEPEIGWALIDRAEGRGIAQEAAIAARRYAYEHLGWSGAVSLIDPENDRSARLARRLGCHDEGIFPHPVLGPRRIWRHPAPDRDKVKDDPRQG